MSGGTRSYEIARRMVLAGHSVTMLTTDRSEINSQGKGWRVTQESGIEVHWLSVPYSNNMGYLSRILAFSRFVFSPVWRSRIIQSDVVLASSTPLTIAIPGVLVSKWRKIPFIFEVRDLWPEIPIALGILRNPVLVFLSRKLARFAYRNANSVIALSPQMKEGVIENGFNRRIKVVTNGVDTKDFRPNKGGCDFLMKEYGIHKAPILISYTGTLGLVNEVTYIVKLAKKFENDNAVMFLLVGNGRDKDKVIDLAIKLGCLNRNLFWIDSLPKEKISYILSITDVSFSTVTNVRELEANSANKVFDSMASGCCVAINHEGWLKKILEDNSAGISLSYDIEKAYVELRELIQNPKKLRFFKSNARKLAEECFDYDILAEDVLMILNESLD